MTDAELAADLAGKAGALLLAVRATSGLSDKALGDAGDHAANQFLIAAIKEQRPDDGLLSEESHCDGERHSKSRVWIIDPVDGSREYGEARTDWAVHVGLAIDGVATTGAVALPGLGLVFRSDQPGPLPAIGDPLRMVVSRTRPAAESIAIAAQLGATLVPMGSAGAKAMAIIRGEADIYLHSGGQNEWDSCAPVAVAQAYELHCSRIDGSPLIYNRAETYIPDLLICREQYKDQLLGMIGALAPTV